MGGVYHTPLGRVFFFKLDYSTTKKVLIPNDTSSDSSRQDVSDAGLFGTDTIPTAAVAISIMENRPRWVLYDAHRRILYLVCK